jgi:hypothetical protein
MILTVVIEDFPDDLYYALWAGYVTYCKSKGLECKPTNDFDFNYNTMKQIGIVTPDIIPAIFTAHIVELNEKLKK